MPRNDYFMGYQKRWLADESRVKLWEKSRRIGATYVASFEDVRDANRGSVPSCWFSSADETAAREYIEYCLKWAKLWNIAAEALGEQIIDESDGVKTYQVRFANGVKIHALSSNPKAFRSKGGKVTLDEFAWHDDARGMWAAARPCITWGYPLRILSTHHGVNSLYNQFIKSIRKGTLDWALHHTPITVAVEDGLADRIARRTLTDDERAAWLDQERASVADDAVWAEEYLCQPQDEASAFLTYDLIRALQRDNIVLPLDKCGPELYAGMDIGRRHDLSVIWVLERLAGMLITRQVQVMRNMPFREQRRALYEVLSNRNVRRCCIDQTGLGMQLAEDAQYDHGAYRVEPVTFTAPVKEAMAYGVKALADDRLLAIPDDYDIREDLHSVRKVVTAAGNVRFDVGASDSRESHADRFWALSLAVHAGSTSSYTTPDVRTRRSLDSDQDRPIFGHAGLVPQTRLDKRLGVPIGAY